MEDSSSCRDETLSCGPRGTVGYADDLQVLVKWDDGHSSNLRVGLDRFRVTH
jgi:hypothetical protein